MDNKEQKTLIDILEIKGISLREILEAYKKTAEKIVELKTALEQASWIPVSDEKRRPEEGQQCICISRSEGIIYTDFYVNGRFQFVNNDYTHWRPVPAFPPKEEEDEE